MVGPSADNITDSRAFERRCKMSDFLANKLKSGLNYFSQLAIDHFNQLHFKMTFFIFFIKIVNLHFTILLQICAR